MNVRVLNCLIHGAVVVVSCSVTLVTFSYTAGYCWTLGPSVLSSTGNTWRRLTCKMKQLWMLLSLRSWLWCSPLQNEPTQQ
jgi:hypothetical protein